MSIHADIVTALAAAGIVSAFPDAAPEDTPLPLTIFKRASFEPVMTLQGYAGQANSVFVFENWAATKLAALTLADQITAAIEAAQLTVLPLQFRVPPPDLGDYEPQSDQYVEPVAFSFWHT